jgi:hypothetical protein
MVTRADGVLPRRSVKKNRRSENENAQRGVNFSQYEER